MAFPPSFLDEIRNRLTCSSVVGRRVRLAKKGREFSGLCPFHNEKSPSFFVNDDKGFFHCFGCGAHGDVIGFQMRIDNMGFPEAVEKLAEEAGLEVPRSTPVDAAREERRKTLADVVEAAAAWFEQQLWSGAGRVGLEYFRRRGLSDETIRAFRLGYAPDGRDALKQALKKQGFEEAMMLEAALLSKPEDGRDSFDFFRGRVMFPITERRGRVIAFGGRILGDGQPKYLNSRDTPLFDKGRNLYAFDKARIGLRDGAEAIVAEGYMDVIALHAAGFRGAVAPLGTALTEGQLELVWRLAPEPIICLDGDAAGQRAARRAAERALPLLKPGRSLRFATMPPGEDPDTLLQSRGRVAVEEILRAARPLVDVIWSTTLEAHTTDTPERRAGFQADLERQVAEITDGAVQELYRQEMRRRMWALLRPESPARRRQGKWAPGRRNSRDTGHAPTAQMSGPLPSPSPGRNIHFLLATVIAFPNVLERDCEIFARVEIADPTLEQLRRAILEAHDANPNLDREHLSLHLNNAGFEGIVARLLGSSIFKGLAFVRTDDGQAAAENWQKTLLELHKRGAQDELRRAGDVSDAGLTELWNRKIEEMQRELVRAQALELEDESPIVEPITPRAGRGPR